MSSTIVDARRLAEQLERLATYRGLVVDRDRSRATTTPTRRAFRLYAHNDTVRFVALFADYSADATKRQQRAPGASVVPSDRSIDWALRTAHKETEHLVQRAGGAGERRLDVVLLRADAAGSSLKMGVEARHYVDQLRLNVTTSQTIRVQLWHVDDVHIDVLDHVDVPTHRLASDAERRRFAADELPLLLLDDPAVRWHGFAIDDVVAIERDDADVGRCVVLHHIVERPGPRGQRVGAK